MKKIISILNNHASHCRDFLLDLLFPIQCLECQTNGEYICRSCLEKININKNLCCEECKELNETGAYCPSCQTKHELSGLWISADYHNSILSKLIKKYKYTYNKNFASGLASLAFNFLRDKRIDKSETFQNSLLIPVPLHNKRQRFRGFNQSELLADLIAKEFNLEINTQGLIRSKNTKAQAKLNRIERLLNVQDAFIWSGENLQQKNIILVDDVSSTGATLDNCAKVLKLNGAKEVWGLVLARN